MFRVLLVLLVLLILLIDFGLRHFLLSWRAIDSSARLVLSLFPCALTYKDNLAYETEVHIKIRTADVIDWWQIPGQCGGTMFIGFVHMW